VLSAFQDQRNTAATDGSNQPGLYWKPISGRWELRQNALVRYGRSYVFSVMADISVPMSPPTNQATITSEQISATVTTPQHVA
jgi:hypothetical protein